VSAFFVGVGMFTLLISLFVLALAASQKNKDDTDKAMGGAAMLGCVLSLALIFSALVARGLA